MKALLTLLFLCLPAFAQTVSEGKPVSFKYDYDGVLPSRIYIDGTFQLKHFTVSELTITTNATGPIYTIKLTVASLPRGQRNITARVVDTDGTESEDSNVVALKVRPKAPWGFSLF